jgi:hypothetical protein
MRNSHYEAEVNNPLPQDVKILFAENFKFLIQKKHLQLGDVSAKTGISVPILEKISNAQFRIGTTMFIDICACLDVTMDSMIRQDLSLCDDLTSTSQNKTQHREIALPMNAPPKLDSDKRAREYRCFPPDTQSEAPQFDIFKWLIKKGFLNVTTPDEDVLKYINYQCDRLEITATQQFDTGSLLTATLTIHRDALSPEPIIDKASASLELVGEDAPVSNTFYPPEIRGFNLKNIYNLLCKRSVLKSLTNPPLDNRPVWLRLDFTKEVSPNEFKLERYAAPEKFRLETLLNLYHIIECDTPEGKKNIINSLKEGDQILVGFRQAKRIDPKFIEADPINRVIKISPFQSQS